MSIVDFIHLHSHILAVDAAGNLLSWDLSPKHSPLLRSTFSHRIMQHTPLGLRESQSQVCIFGKKEIIIIGKKKLIECLEKYELMQINEEVLGCRRILMEDIDKNEEVRCLISLPMDVVEQEKENEMRNEEQQEQVLIVGCKTGKILSISLSKTAEPHILCEIAHGQSEMSPYKSEQITSLLPFRSNTLLIVGTSQGRILIINLNLKKVVEDITQSNKLQIEGVRFLQMGLAEHKFYSAHMNYVVEWSVELLKPLGYYQFKNAYTVAASDTILDLKPKVLIGGGSKNVWMVEEGKSRELETSLLSIHCIKVKGDSIWLGGNNGMIEILQGCIPSAMLFWSP